MHFPDGSYDDTGYDPDEINSVISNCENLNENILAQALNVVWIKNKLSEENADLNLILNKVINLVILEEQDLI